MCTRKHKMPYKSISAFTHQQWLPHCQPKHTTTNHHAQTAAHKPQGHKELYITNCYTPYACISMHSTCMYIYFLSNILLYSMYHNSRYTAITTLCMSVSMSPWPFSCSQCNILLIHPYLLSVEILIVDLCLQHVHILSLLAYNTYSLLVYNYSLLIFIQGNNIYY